MAASPNLIDLLVVSPGDLIYYLAVFAIAQAALFMALGARARHKHIRAPRVYAIAHGGVVVAWTLLLLAALFALVTNSPSNAILPPTDRLVHTLVITVLGWAFLTADDERLGRIGNIALLIVLAWTAVGFVVTGIEWSDQYMQIPFNEFSFNSTWVVITLVICAVGVVVSVTQFRRIPDAPLKIVFFLVLVLGYGAALMMSTSGAVAGDYLGVTRWAFLSAVLVALGIVYRMVVQVMDESQAAPVVAPRGMMPQAGAFAPLPPEPVISDMPRTQLPVTPMPERESAQLMKALGIMLEKASPDAIPERIIQSALNTLKADVGALLQVQGRGYVDIATGFDRTMNRPIRPNAVNLAQQPTLANAIERRVQRSLLKEKQPEEIAELYSRMDIDTIGPVYFQPLVSEGELLAVLMIGLPYSDRELGASDQELLKGIAIIAANLLSLSYASRSAQLSAEARAIEAMAQGVPIEDVSDGSALSKWNEMRGELEAARDQINQLSMQVTSLRIELDDERSRVKDVLSDTSQTQSASQRIITLNEAHQRLIDERDRLAARLREAEMAMASASDESAGGVMASMVELLRREKDDLAAQRDRMQREIAELRAIQGAESPGAEGVASRMVQDQARLERERDELTKRLAEMESRLGEMGVAVGEGNLAQMVAGVFDQQIALQAQVAAVQRERDALLSGESDAMMQRQVDRDKIVLALQNEIANLAADRESVTKARDKIRSERDELLRKQESMRSLQARVLAENAAYEQELIEAHGEIEDVRTELQRIANERISLAQERDSLLAERQSLESARDQLMARIEGDRSRLQQLGADGVGALTKMIDELTAQRAAVERELNETRGKLASVENRLEMAEIRAATVQPEVIYRSDNPDALIGMIQELRTPMTSIVGYVDLLLNESAGILGEMQRKFLQRVSANVNRLSSMMDDLIQLSYLDAGKFRLKPQLINAIEVLEDAISNASAPLREKGLTVNLELDDDAPIVCADRDALLQVIGQLLTNAYLASPSGTQLNVRAKRHMMNRQVGGQVESYPVLLISFEDAGGGIALEDQSRVFARKYKAENPLIQGLGDTGVGLAIAKSLVEAHDGEIWVESKPGRGASFNFILPAEPEQALE